MNNNVETFKANLRHAISNRERVFFGGGEFFHDELKDVLRALDLHGELVAALKAEAAVNDIPFLDGEESLKTLGWNGEQDIEEFIHGLRRSVLKKV